MDLGDLIRRRLPEIAFAALFGAGLVLGGNAALAGLPVFVDAALPGMGAQADVGDGDWEITEMHLNITGKILLVKNLSMISDEVLTGYRRVPDHLTFAKGVEMLKAEQEKQANNNPPETSNAKKMPQ